MIDITVDYDEFDINRLIDSTLKFAEKNFPLYFAIPWVNSENDSPEYSRNSEEVDNGNLPDNSDRDYIEELVNEKKLLFFTFSTNNVGDPVNCADGQSYIIDDSTDNPDEDSFNLGDTECLGFLFEYNQSKLRIRSALNWSGACMCPSAIYVCEDAGIFEEPMKTYINSFFKERTI